MTLVIAAILPIALYWENENPAGVLRLSDDSLVELQERIGWLLRRPVGRPPHQVLGEQVGPTEGVLARSLPALEGTAPLQRSR